MNDYAKLRVLAEKVIAEQKTGFGLAAQAEFSKSANPSAVLGLITENTQYHGECNDHMETIGRLKAELAMLRYAVNPCSHKIGLSDSPGHATARCVSLEAARKLGSAMWPGTFEVVDTATGERV